MATDRQSVRAELAERFPRHHGQLLPALHFLQHEFRYLPDWGLETVGWHLRIPASEVYGAATTYTELRLTPPGVHVVRVCTGLACSMGGGRELLAALSRELGVAPGHTTADGRATLEETPCGFLCAMAPALDLDGRWRGRASPQGALDLLRKAVGR